MITGSDNKYYRPAASYESRILNGEAITEEEINKPFAFLFNNICKMITDAETASNVMKFIHTLKRDEDVLNCLSHIYNRETRRFILHVNNHTIWYAVAERCWKHLDYTKSSMSDRTCRL